MLFDPTLSLPFVAMLFGLFALAAFDFYAYAPRPSGVSLRSRELAPALVILLSVAGALYSLSLLSLPNSDSLIANGASYAPRTLNSERMRLLIYPFVITNPFESVFLALTLVTSAIFAGSLGMLGWSIVVIGTTAGTGLTAALIDPESIISGPQEVSIGLLVASIYFFANMYRNKIMTSITVSISTLLISAIGCVSLALIRDVSFRFEYLFVASILAVSISHFFSKIKFSTGPHWESTSIFLVSAVGAAIVGGLVVYFAPRGFDLPRWRTDGVVLKNEIHKSLLSEIDASTTRPLEASRAKYDITFADRLKSDTRQIEIYIAHARDENGLNSIDQTRIKELELIARMINILERLHRSRAAVVNAEDQRVSHKSAPFVTGQIDGLQLFWDQDRPWMDSELVSLSLFAEQNSTPSLQNFLVALNVDLERLTQAALELEIRRVDAWVDWATLQPRGQLPSIKLIAVAQVSRLEAITSNAKNMRLPVDPRISALHRNLRRMASVSSSANWE